MAKSTSILGKKRDPKKVRPSGEGPVSLSQKSFKNRMPDKKLYPYGAGIAGDEGIYQFGGGVKVLDQKVVDGKKMYLVEGDTVEDKDNKSNLLKNIQVGLDLAQFVPNPAVAGTAYFASLPFTTYDIIKDIKKEDWKQAGLDALGYIPTFKAFKYGIKGDKALDTTSKLAKQLLKLNTIINSTNFAVDLNKKEKGGVIKDNRGQWAYPGEVTQIDSPYITMQGVPYPVMGVSDEGDVKLMLPNRNYFFEGNSVTEYPMMQKGGSVPTLYVSDPNNLRLKAYQDSSTLYKNWLEKYNSLVKKAKEEENKGNKVYVKTTHPEGYSENEQCTDKAIASGNCAPVANSNLYNFIPPSSPQDSQYISSYIKPSGFNNFLIDNLLFDRSIGKIYDFSNVKPKQEVRLKEQEKIKPVTKTTSRGQSIPTSKTKVTKSKPTTQQIQPVEYKKETETYLQPKGLTKVESSKSKVELPKGKSQGDYIINTQNSIFRVPNKAMFDAITKLGYPSKSYTTDATKTGGATFNMSDETLKSYLKDYFGALEKIGDTKTGVKKKVGGKIKAQQGVLIRNTDGTVSSYNPEGQEYRKLYESGQIGAYDEATNSFYPSGTLPEVTITAQRPKSFKDFFRRYNEQISKDNQDTYNPVGPVLQSIYQLPQAAVTYALDPKSNVLPSKAFGISEEEHPYWSMFVNAVADPTNLVGAGLTDDAFKITSKIGKFLTNKTPLKDAYKINPWRFKPKEGMMYRGTGESGIEDAIKSGLIRQNPRGEFANQDLFATPYFKLAEMYAGLDKLRYGKGEKGIIEIPKNIANFIQDDLGGLHFRTSDVIPTSDVKLYKEDWLREYKPIEVPKQSFQPITNFAENAPKSIGNELYDLFKEMMRIKNLPELNNPQVNAVLENLKKRVATPEGQRRLKNLGITTKEPFKNLKIVSDPEALGYYTNNKIGINPYLPEFKRVTRHELEHFIQDLRQESLMDIYNRNAKNFKYLFKPQAKKEALKLVEKPTTEIDDLLANLELRNIPEKVDWDAIKAKKEKKDPSKLFDYLSNKQNATNYFDSGSRGREKSAFLGEVQQYMMDKGIIPTDEYVNVTPEMVENTFVDAMFDEEGKGKYLRLFNIMRPSSKNYELISEGLNKMLGVTPYVGVGTLGKYAFQKPEQKLGGKIKDFKYGGIVKVLKEKTVNGKKQYLIDDGK